MSKKKKVAKLAKADIKATHKAARARKHPVVKVTTTVSEVADQPPLIALSLATLSAGVALRAPGLVRSGARMLTSHLIATGIKTVFKGAVDRTRPAAALEGLGHRIAKGSGTENTDLNSFPSGHTAGAVAVAQAIGHDRPDAALPAKLAAGAIGAAQLPGGKHYGSDVLAGAAIGWMSEKIASALIDVVERRTKRFASGVEGRGEAEAEVEAHPS